MSNKRYFSPELLEKMLAKLDNSIEKYEIGRSVKGLPIIELKVGYGKKKPFHLIKLTTCTQAPLSFFI